MTSLHFLHERYLHAASSGTDEGGTMRTERFDKLNNEQQDHLFYALHDAREAANERW